MNYNNLSILQKKKMEELLDYGYIIIYYNNSILKMQKGKSGNTFKYIDRNGKCK